MTRSSQIAIIHGPNLNQLGIRENHIYGQTTLDEINRTLSHLGDSLGATLTFFQNNSEGALVDHIQKLLNQCDGIVINAAAYTHTSIAIRDALAGTGVPFVEVHLSNIYNREEFRHNSLLAPIAKGVICGFGPFSYQLGLLSILNKLPHYFSSNSPE